MIEMITTSPQETKKVAALLAAEVFCASRTQALVIALKGKLGAGKTTFVQGFARALGIRETIQSPTFVLLKAYTIKGKFKYFIHIDCYRIRSPEELAHLGFKEIFKDKDAIVLIEWADKIRRFMPKRTLWLLFKHGNGIQERIIQLKTQNSKVKTTA